MVQPAGVWPLTLICLFVILNEIEISQVWFGEGGKVFLRSQVLKVHTILLINSVSTVSGFTLDMGFGGPIWGSSVRFPQKLEI